MLSLHLLALILFAPSSSIGLALPAALSTEFEQQSNSQSFIVKLKPGHSSKSHFSSVQGQMRGKVKSGRTAYFDSRVFNGYAIELADQAAVEALSQMDSVEYVELDVVLSVASLSTQTSAPWGLQAITRSVSPHTIFQIIGLDTLIQYCKLRLHSLSPTSLPQP
jgi:hypothetical protein